MTGRGGGGRGETGSGAQGGGGRVVEEGRAGLKAGGEQEPVWWCSREVPPPQQREGSLGQTSASCPWPEPPSPAPVSRVVVAEQRTLILIVDSSIYCFSDGLTLLATKCL